MTGDGWSAPDDVPALSREGVHVWRVPLDTPEEELASLTCLLSSDERARADRYRRPRDGARFIVARATLRLLLGRYLDRPPAALTFDYGPQGKPVLSRAGGALRFNVSHSAGLGLIAVVGGGEVGVDVEQVRPDFDWAPVAARFFCPAELVWLGGLPPQERVEGFFRLWTRKEALLKARGEGVWCDLDRFDVSESPPRPAQERGTSDASPWFLRDLDPGGGYRAALAVSGPVPPIATWHWPGMLG